MPEKCFRKRAESWAWLGKSLRKPPDIATAVAPSGGRVAELAPKDSSLSRWGVHGSLFVVQVAFAAGAVEGKLALDPPSMGGAGVDPLALAMSRMVGAALFFQAFMRATGQLRPVPAAEHRRIAGLSILGVVLNQTLFLVGLKITTAFAAALLGATIPVFAAALAVAFRVERPSLRTAAGLSLAIAGVLWLTGVGSLDWGAVAIAANCLSYALYIVLSKRVIERLGAATVVTWLFTWGALVMAPFGAKPLLAGAATWGARGWAFVAFFIAVPTIVAYLANAWALARSGPTLVTVYIYLQPLIAALMQWLQLGQSIAPRAAGAAAFILAGVGVVATRPAAPPQR
jgi:drug/metabolite transporter (DMT)-like permease